MTVELINTGSELLLGRVLNTHLQWLGRRLADLGLPLSRQSAVPDTADGIVDAVREALGRADLVITTGGLGPTCDDITRDRIAGLLGRPLEFRPEAWEQVVRYFGRIGRTPPERTRVEAFAPAGARILANSHGTAPGLAIEINPNPFRAAGAAAWLVLLPGPPRELRPMVDDVLLPWLRETLRGRPEFASTTVKTSGLGESLVEERLEAPLAPHLAGGVELAFCARLGEVEVRLSAAGTAASVKVAAAVSAVRAALAEFVFGFGDETLEANLIARLAARRATLATAESCTGGLLAHRVTNVPGASRVFLGGFAAYANSVKTSALGVPESLILAHGAVSEPVARAMAEGARRAVGADYALATTGVAGPDGGTAEKPVGAVWIALAGPDGTEAWKRNNPFDRETFKQATAQQAFMALWNRLGQAAEGAG